MKYVLIALLLAPLAAQWEQVLTLGILPSLDANNPAK